MGDSEAYLQAQDAFRRFVAVCLELSQKVKPDTSNFRILISPHLRPRVLAEAAEKTEEFAEFARSMFVAAPPDPTRCSIGIVAEAMEHAYQESGGQFKVSQIAVFRLRETAIALAHELIEKHPAVGPNTLDARILAALQQRGRHDLANFLRRIGFYHQVFGGSAIDCAALVNRFRDPPIYEATILITVNGLCLDGGDVVLNETTRLRTLDREMLNEFFENPQVAAFGTAADTRPLEGRSFLWLDRANQSDDVPFDLGVNHAHPWLSYINMFSAGTLHCGESFFKYNSMRRHPFERSDAIHHDDKRGSVVADDYADAEMRSERTCECHGGSRTRAHGGEGTYGASRKRSSSVCSSLQHL